MLTFGQLKPMEPRSAKEAFDSEEYVFQVKWDGVRMVAFVDKGIVRLQNRKLHPRTQVYPDFQNLHHWIHAEQAILDGEMVAFGENGKPSFKQILSRDLKTDPTAIRMAAQQLPSTYIAFDLLALNGEELLTTPLERRLALLREIAHPSDHFQVIEDFTSGTALFQVIQGQEMEGIVAKLKRSPYVPGEKLDYWLKIKTKKDLIAVVGGYTVKERWLNSLLFGLYLEDQLFYIGNAATGLKANDLKLLDTYLAQMELPRSPFANPPRLYGVRTHWTQPLVTAKLEFMEWTEEIQMRAPVILGFTKDQPTDCQLH